MLPRLVIANAVIGLAHPSPPWPDDLYRAGYALARIEQGIGVAGGKVVVDLVHAAHDANAALCIEGKDGTVQEKQARSYEAMTAQDLIQTGNVSLPDPPAATLDVAYAVAPQHVASALRSLADYAPSVGVIEIGPEIRWHGSKPKAPALRTAFDQPIAADMATVPRLLVVDDASPSEDLAPYLANELHGVIVRGRDSVTVTSLIEMACWGWPQFSRALQSKLAKAVQKMLREAAKNELNGVVKTVTKNKDESYATVHLEPSTIADTQAGELRVQRSVRARLDAFVTRVTGTPSGELQGQLQIGLPGDEDEDFDYFAEDEGN